MTRCSGRGGRDEGVTNFCTSQPDGERDVGEVGGKTGRNCESLTLTRTRHCHGLDTDRTTHATSLIYFYNPSSRINSQSF